MPLTESNLESDKKIRTRRVHYISGFDPRGAAYYHRLFREEACKQGSLNKAQIHVGSRSRLNANVTRWEVSSKWDGEPVHTDYQFMHWDDLVRRHWEKKALPLLVQGMSLYLRYIGCGALSRVRQVAPSAALSGIFPLLFYIVCMACAFCTAVLAFGLAIWLGVALWGAFCSMIFVFGLVLFFVWSLAERMGVLWLLRTYLFVFRWGNSQASVLEQRAEEFAAHILKEQKRAPVDEVLLVGHSVGTMVAVQVAALMASAGNLKSGTLEFSLITLGQCIPFLSFIPQASEFRKSLESVSWSSHLSWTDVTIPPDALCFYRVDPLSSLEAGCGGSNRPRLAVARIFRMFSGATYSKMRWNKLRIHFQYLMASESPADYDFFLFTCGPLSAEKSLSACLIQQHS